MWVGVRAVDRERTAYVFVQPLVSCKPSGALVRVGWGEAPPERYSKKSTRSKKTERHEATFACVAGDSFGCKHGPFMNRSWS